MGPDQRHSLDRATEALRKAFNIDSESDTPARNDEGFLRYLEVSEKTTDFHPLLNEEKNEE